MISAGLLALALVSQAAALEVPYLSGRVNDQAGLLSPSSQQSLEAKLKDFETRTGHQVAVLTLPSLEGEVLESFSLKVSRTWGLGRKGVNDGVLFLISKSDRKLRIEVGHGLEGSIPDALAGRIIQDVVVPKFRTGDFEGGVTAGVEAIVAAAEGTYSPPPPREQEEFHGGLGDNLLERLMISAFVFGILGLFEFIGLITPGSGGWFLYFFLIPFWAAFPMAIWGARIGMGCLLTHLIGFAFVKSMLPHTEFGRKFRTVGNKTYYGDTLLFTTTSGGSSSSGGGWSSGGGGGGFSGGGGSFGGGGSSGSW
ncbi:MAG: TPM domain-containing protein [Elusimicrobia bacterium]|nr:TPM domain-containing protein [Elusimicrobiota bacterium]